MVWIRSCRHEPDSFLSHPHQTHTNIISVFVRSKVMYQTPEEVPAPQIQTRFEQVSHRLSASCSELRRSTFCTFLTLFAISLIFFEFLREKPTSNATALLSKWSVSPQKRSKFPICDLLSNTTQQMVSSALRWAGRRIQ